MKKRLIIVDDEETVCNSLKAALDILGYEVETALDSTEAFKLIEGFKPQLMLLDLHLPKGLSGIQILERVNQTNPDLKVIVITGFGMKKEIEDKCFSLGAVKFLRKPLSIAEFKKHIDEVL